MKKEIDIIDLYQGQGLEDRPFGYVGITDAGGYFFDWLDTLDETVGSMQADEIDPPASNFRHAAMEALRDHIADDFGRLHAAAYGPYPFHLCK